MKMKPTRGWRVVAITTTAVMAGSAFVALAAPAMAAPRVVTAYEVPAFPETPIGPERDPNKPNVVVIDAGGTVSSKARDRISYQHYSGIVEGGVQAILQDLYPELAPIANLSVVAVTDRVLGSSGNVRTSALYNVSRTADMLLANPDVDGIVITAGTSVLEEDAYFMDLTIQSDKPVVVTGAMHQYGTFTYDGYTNLFSSIRLAASGKTTCYGTVVLLNDQFFAARDVTKTDGYRMDTFEARQYGALGVVNEDVIRPMRAPARISACGTDAWKTPFDLTKTEPDALPQVDIAYGYVEASAATITGPVAAGAKGIVTAGSGPGSLSYLQTPAVRDAAAQGVVFVSTSRTGGEGTYDSGSGSTIGGGDLLPQKARLLLQLSLAFSADVDQVRSWFTTIGDASFNMNGANVVEPEPEPEPTGEPSPEPSGSSSPGPTEEPTPTGEPSPSSTPLVGATGPSGKGGGGALASTGFGFGLGGVALAGALAAAAGLIMRTRRKREEHAITHG